MNAVASQGLEKAGSDSAGIASDGRRCIPAPLADHDGETPLQARAGVLFQILGEERAALALGGTVRARACEIGPPAGESIVRERVGWSRQERAAAGKLFHVSPWLIASLLK